MGGIPITQCPFYAPRGLMEVVSTTHPLLPWMLIVMIVEEILEEELYRYTRNRWMYVDIILHSSGLVRWRWYD